MIMLDLISPFPFPYKSGNAMGPSPLDLRTNCEGFHQKGYTFFLPWNLPGILPQITRIGWVSLGCRSLWGGMPLYQYIAKISGKPTDKSMTWGVFFGWGWDWGFGQRWEADFFCCGWDWYSRYGYCFPKVGIWDSYFIITWRGWMEFGN